MEGVISMLFVVCGCSFDGCVKWHGWVMRDADMILVLVGVYAWVVVR